MATPMLLHPQFFHTLVSGFHTHFTIPADFFSKYVEEKNVEKKTAKLIYDSSEITWKVKMIGRRFCDGWEEFVVANNFQIGDVVLIKYERDMIFRVLDLGPNCSEIQDFSRKNNDDDQDNILGRSSLSKKQSHPRTDDDNDNEELPKTKKVRLSDSTSSSQEQFVTLTIRPYCFEKCILRLPGKFTRENHINKLKMITLLGKDGRKYETRLLSEKGDRVALGYGWKHFVKANGLKIGDSFTLKLIWEDKTPVLSLLCPQESSTDNKEEGMCFETNPNIEENSSLISTSPSQKRFMQITIKERMRLPNQFVKENGMNKPGLMIYLMAKDCRKWRTNIVQERDGRINLGNGWKVFVEANGLKLGESFTMELILEEATPMLRFVSTIENRFVTLTLTQEDASACKLYLPSEYMRANGINKLGKIKILSEIGPEWYAHLMSKDGLVALGIGWEEFCEANGVKIGMCFTLEFINEQDNTTTLVLKFHSH